MKGVIFDGRIKKKLNGKIAAKQIGRIVEGITDCQINISKEFPDEYATMTEKVVEAFENH